MVAEALADGDTSAKVAGEVLTNVNDFVPDDDWMTLQTVAVYADRHRVALDPAVVARIARVGDGHAGRDAPLLLRLLDGAAPATSADQIVQTFMHLGKPYNRITNSQDTFELDFNDVHDRLLKILHADNRITRGHPRIPNRRYSVSVL